MSLSNVIWKLKTGKRSFLNSVFKHPKIGNVTQTLLKKHPYQTHFFLEPQFSVFKHWNVILNHIPKALSLEMFLETFHWKKKKKICGDAIHNNFGFVRPEPQLICMLLKDIAHNERFQKNKK